MEAADGVVHDRDDCGGVCGVCGVGASGQEAPVIVDDASVVAVWLDDPDALVDPWAGVPWVRLTLTVAAFAVVGAALGLAERAMT
jgi:hypothetical protein